MEQEKVGNPSIFENFTKHFSLLTICFFFLGYLYLSSYYGAFKIDILNYLTPIEVLYTLLPLATVFLIVAATFRNVYTWLFSKDSSLEHLTNRQLIVKALKSLILFGLLYCVIWVLLPNWLGENHKGSALLKLLLYGLTFASFFERLYSGLFKRLDLHISEWLFSGYLLVTAITNFGKHKAAEAKRWGRDIEVTVKLKENCFKTNNTLVLIGECQANLFFYNKLDSTTSVVKREDIDSLMIK